MRLVILPQAFRVALPAIGNQSLNLLKNSSLGAAISYFELTPDCADYRGEWLPRGSRVHSHSAGLSVDFVDHQSGHQHLQ